MEEGFRWLWGKNANHIFFISIINLLLFWNKSKLLCKETTGCNINRAVGQSQFHIQSVNFRCYLFDFSSSRFCAMTLKGLVMPAPQDGADGCLSGHVIWLWWRSNMRTSYAVRHTKYAYSGRDQPEAFNTCETLTAWALRRNCQADFGSRIKTCNLMSLEDAEYWLKLR